jgi:hypothetical protein
MLNESSVPTTGDLPEFGYSQPQHQRGKIDNPLTIASIAVLLLGQTDKTWSATGKVVLMLLLLFNPVVASTSLSSFRAIAAFAVMGRS